MQVRQCSRERSPFANEWRKFADLISVTPNQSTVVNEPAEQTKATENEQAEQNKGDGGFVVEPPSTVQQPRVRPAQDDGAFVVEPPRDDGAQVHRKLLCGHQGIRHINSHHIEAACFVGPHGYRLTCLGGSLSVPAPHTPPHGQFWGRWAQVPEWWFMCM